MRSTLVGLKTLVMELVNMEEEAGALTVKDNYKAAKTLKARIREHIASCKKYNEFIEEIRKEIKEKRRLKNEPEEDGTQDEG